MSNGESTGRDRSNRESDSPRAKSWFRHAFAVDSPGVAEPSVEEQDVVDDVLRRVARRRLEVPATLFMECFRPMNYLAAQAMHFGAPVGEILFPEQPYRTFAGFLERRGSVDYMTNRLAELAEEGKTKKAAKTKGSSVSDKP